MMLKISEITANHNNYDKIGMKGVTFTLSKKQTDGSYRKVDDYTTGENGLLSIDIAQKGYLSVEGNKNTDWLSVK